MGIESTMGSYQGSSLSSTNTGAANRGAMTNAGYGGVRFRDTKGDDKKGKKAARGREVRQPNWGAAGISDTKAKQYGPKTVAEVAGSRSGIAPTAKNMGSLAVQFRADEATALKAGELTDRNKRDQRIIDERGVEGGVPQGDSALATFKKKYWGARAEWAEDKGAYSGIVPSGSTASTASATSHSQRTAPKQLTRRLGTSNGPRSPRSGPRSNSMYGLF